MKITRPNSTRVRVAALALAALALVLPAAPAVHAAGLRNCVDVTGRAAALVGCYEDVWVNGVQLKMTFFAGGTTFQGATPSERVDSFYVLAPQTETAQGTLPFAHDHVVGNVPRESDGEYGVHLHGFLVLCTAQGIATGGCEPTMASVEGLGTLPLARTVNGQPLTVIDRIESAADAGLVVLFDTGAVIIGAITAGN